MFTKIATSYYGYPLNNSAVILMIAALLVISLILTVVIGEVIGLIPGVGWVVKTLVAAAVIWGLGEGSILVLDRMSASNP